MRSGAILDRSGKPYKPKTVRSYEHALENYVYPLLGSRKVSSLRRADIQGFVEEMREFGAAPSTVHNRLDPLRVIVWRSIDNDDLLVDPCARLKMPVVRNRRTRIESSTTAEALVAALPESEQAFWALALFAGVRRGELRGLRVDDIDFDAGLVRVRRGWDDLEGEIDPKTFAGARDIPMIGELRRICRAHKLQTGRHGTELFLGRTRADPFYPSTIRLRALKAWGWKQVPNPHPGPPQKIWIKDRADALQPLTPHEARHCAASYMIAAGMDWKKITEFIGHSDVRTTYNRYGKVVPEDRARRNTARGILRPGPRETSISPSGREEDWCWQRDGGQAAPTAPERVTDSKIGSAGCARASHSSRRRGWGRGPSSKPEIAGSASR
jgi:integrase